MILSYLAMMSRAFCSCRKEKEIRRLLRRIAELEKAIAQEHACYDAKKENINLFDKVSQIFG